MKKINTLNIRCDLRSTGLLLACVYFLIVLLFSTEPTIAQDNSGNVTQADIDKVTRENLAAANADIPTNLSGFQEAQLLNDILDMDKLEELDPTIEDGLLAVVSDTHGKVEEFRKIVRQIIQTARLSGIPKEKIKLIHLGDWGDGEDPAEAAKLARMLIEEFGFEKSQVFSAFGNYEYRGFNKRTVGEEKVWREEVIKNMLPYVTPLLNEDGDFLADDEVSFLKIRDGLNLALSHKPLIPLQVSSNKEDRLVSRLPSQINFRNYMVLHHTAFWHLQNFLSLGKADPLEKPKWEPDTRQTMKRNISIPSYVDVYFNAHTHRGFVAVLPVKNEDGEYRYLPIANAGTGFLDEKVSGNAPSFATVRIGAKSPYVRIHRADQNGRIAFSLPVLSGIDWPLVEEPMLKPGKAKTCRRVLGSLDRNRKGFIKRLKNDIGRVTSTSNQ